MCGIAGLRTFAGDDPARLAGTAEAMAARLRHRGPDHAATWGTETVAFGHRRLSILDTSPGGHQPMVGPRYVLCYNGEVYNFRALRAELPDYPFTGGSDTEVLLALCERYGLEQALRRCVGMFALALWDRQESRLLLARDRLGKKPLYYGWAGDTFLFGSELKALTAFPGFPCEVDRGSLALYLRYGYVPAPYSIYRSVRKLRPGHWGELSAAGGWREESYWEPTLVPGEGSVEEADSLLTDAVRLRLESDVPLGAFLSGGIDSSLVVAVAQSLGGRPLRTFCIGFEAPGFPDEAPHAAALARFLGTSHETLYVGDAEALAVVPRLADICDEPLSDSSLIPTFLVSELARRHVTVALSGDGGDELFFGYPRQSWARNVWRGLSLLPVNLRRALAHVVERVPVPERRWRRLPQLLRCARFHELYRSALSQWELPLTRAPAHPTLVDAPLPGPVETQIMVADLALYLADDILTKVDRASMAVSLEARAPLLDHRLVEWALRAPFNLKLRQGQTKWVLRELLARRVPRELFERPKQGFGVPVERWLRGALRDWAEELLASERLRPFLDPGPVRRVWHNLLQGREPHAYLIWNVLAWQAWLARMPWS